jgi:hypothetical protein
LYLDNAVIADLTPLAGLDGQQALYLNNAAIAGLSPVQHIKELADLRAVGLAGRVLQTCRAGMSGNVRFAASPLLPLTASGEYGP